MKKDKKHAKLDKATRTLLDMGAVPDNLKRKFRLQVSHNRKRRIEEV